jgi:hypothetical protein
MIGVGKHVALTQDPAELFDGGSKRLFGHSLRQRDIFTGHVSPWFKPIGLYRVSPKDPSQMT